MITVEDVNSVNLKPINRMYTLKTNKISLDEFNNVLYDFIKVSHSISGSTHTFIFEVHNSLWHGIFKCYGHEAESINGNVSYSNNKITITTTYEWITASFYLCSYDSGFTFNTNITYVPNIDCLIIKKNEIGEVINIPIINPKGNVIETDVLISSSGIITMYSGLLLVLIKKTNLLYDLSSLTLINGLDNRIRLNVNENYLPNGDLVDSNLLDIKILYRDKVIEVEYDDELEDYCFNLDLSDKKNNRKIEFSVLVNESKYVNRSLTKFVIPCEYSKISTFGDLQTLVGRGIEVVELSSDINFSSNLILSNDLYIMGKGFQVNLSNNSIVVDDSYSLKLENVTFVNGNPCIIQKSNSKLEVSNSLFSNASISDVHKGSVLSILGDENIVSEFRGCSIYNCHHSIWHNGRLTIDNCKALYNIFNESVDTDYAEFLNCYSAEVEISNSIFDIDFNIDTLCTNEEDIKFAQSLIGLGEGTVINNITYDKLVGNDTMPLCNNRYNNLSHIFVKYYYPQLETCVFSSPVNGREDECLCHHILGSDWVYKNNVQITKSSWNTENNIRKIIWEDLNVF